MFQAKYTGLVTPKNQSSFLILICSGALALFTCLMLMTLAAIVENFYRKRFDDYQFIFLSKFGSSNSNDYFISQMFMSLDFCMGELELF